MGFDVLRRAADEWHTVEIADKARATLKKRPTANASGNRRAEVDQGKISMHPRQHRTKYDGAAIERAIYGETTLVTRRNCSRRIKW